MNEKKKNIFKAVLKCLKLLVSAFISKGRLLKDLNTHKKRPLVNAVMNLQVT